VVNQPFAARVFNGAAIGQTVLVANRGEDYTSSIEARIVGIAETMPDLQYSTREGAAPAIYVLSSRNYKAAMKLYVRARMSTHELSAGIRSVVRQIDARVPIIELASLHEINERRLLAQIWLARAAAFLGFVALVLATCGLYGVVSYLVDLRSREFALRMALGGSPRNVLSIVLVEAMKLTALGGAIGGSLAFAMSLLLRHWNRAYQDLDLLPFAGSAALLLAATLLASATPALRAALIDPAITLRHD
jgi:hypothetical protein